MKFGTDVVYGVEIRDLRGAGIPARAAGTRSHGYPPEKICGCGAGAGI